MPEKIIWSGKFENLKMGGELTSSDGLPEKNNFHTYRMIRQKVAPKSIEVNFVQSDHDPTGLGGPLFPFNFAALANALYRVTGKRFYDQLVEKQLQEAKRVM